MIYSPLNGLQDYHVVIFQTMITNYVLCERLMTTYPAGCIGAKYYDRTNRWYFSVEGGEQQQAEHACNLQFTANGVRLYRSAMHRNFDANDPKFLDQLNDFFLLSKFYSLDLKSWLQQRSSGTALKDPRPVINGFISDVTPRHAPVTHWFEIPRVD
jgi:hypothetical protein